MLLNADLLTIAKLSTSPLLADLILRGNVTLARMILEAGDAPLFFTEADLAELRNCRHPTFAIEDHAEGGFRVVFK